MSNRQILTLDEFTFQQYRKIPNATGELSSLLRDIGLAAKRINAEVNKTRIETNPIRSSLVNICCDYMKLPLQQGLRLTGAGLDAGHY